MGENRKINLVFEVGIGLGICWKISTSGSTVLVPTREIKRLIESTDHSTTRIILSDEKSIQVPMSIEEILKTLNTDGENAYEIDGCL